MNDALNQKVVAVTSPVAIVDNASWTTNEIDTIGFRFCSIYVMLGALDIAIAALKVQESNTSGSGMADITETVFGGTGNPALPGATADNNIYAIHIDLRGRKRYLDLVLTGGDGAAGSFATAWAVLSRGEQLPASAAARGLTAEAFA